MSRKRSHCCKSVLVAIFPRQLKSDAMRPYQGAEQSQARSKSPPRCLPEAGRQGLRRQLRRVAVRLGGTHRHARHPDRCASNRAKRRDLHARATAAHSLRHAASESVQRSKAFDRPAPRRAALRRWGFNALHVLQAIQAAHQDRTIGQVYEGNRTLDATLLLAPALRWRPEAAESSLLRTQGRTCQCAA